MKSPEQIPMNSLERYNGMVDGRSVDFVPRIPILMQFAAQYIDVPYGLFCSDYRVKVKGNLRCSDDFGLDLVGVMSDPYSETQGYGAEIIYHDRSTPECRRPPLADGKDLDALPRPDPLVATRMKNTVNTVRAYHEQVGGERSILGWVEGPIAEAADLRGLAPFMMDLLEDPDWSAELMTLCVEVATEYARAQVEAGADTIGIGDALASQISPALYTQAVLPLELRLATAIKEMGARVRLHICGNITHLLEGIAELPIDIIDVDHLVDLVQVRETLPGHVTLGCNIDPVAGVLHGDPESIRRAVLDAYARVGNPFFVNAGCEIPPGTPHENLRALCEPIPYRS